MDTFETVGRRNDGRLVETVKIEARIVFARAPGIEDRLRRGVDRGRQRDDGPRIQGAIRPSVEPLADAGREGIVDGRVAERAGNANARQHILAIDVFYRTLQ